MKELRLVGGEIALVSDEDHEWLSEYRWMLVSPRSGPVRRMGSGRQGKALVVWMHREILGLPRKAQEGDQRRGKHLNGNPLDNRRENLIITSPSSDSQNRRAPKRNPDSRYGSKYIGARKSSPNRFSAQIKIRGKKMHLGSFESEEEAARAYDEAARKLHGPRARVNFPED